MQLLSQVNCRAFAMKVSQMLGCINAGQVGLWNVCGQAAAGASQVYLMSKEGHVSAHSRLLSYLHISGVLRNANHVSMSPPPFLLGEAWQSKQKRISFLRLKLCNAGH